MQASWPRAFWPLLILVGGASIGLAAWVLASGPSNLWHLLVVSVAAAGLELTGAQLNRDVRASLSVVVLFAAIAYGGMVLAVGVGLASGIMSSRAARSSRLVKTVYNASMGVLAAGSAALVFSGVTRIPLLAPAPEAALQDPAWMTAGLLLAGVAYSVVNTLLMAAVLSTVNTVPYAATFIALLRDALLLQFVYVGLGAIAYVLFVRVEALALLLVMVPLLVARRSLLTVQHRQEAFDRMVRSFVKAIELKDGYTRGHAERVSDLSVLVAERMGLSYEERQLIRYGAILHDVGKIGVSLGILCKAGPLTDEEFDEMKLHPEIGSEMLADIDFLQPALTIVHHHHERVDGRGYPSGLSAESIPLLTRVVTAVDAFDAMTSTRPYRRALPVPVAIEELQANAGTQFDAEVVEHLVAAVAEHGWTVTDEPVAVATSSRGGPS